MKKLFWLLLLCASAFGQSNYINANIGAAGSTCAATAPFNCAVMQLPSGAQSVGITIGGTFSATLQFEVSGDAGNTYVAGNALPALTGAAVSSSTVTGLWIVPAAGMTHVRVRASAYTSGTASATLTASPAGVAGNAIGPNGSNLDTINPTASAAAAISPVVSAAVESGHVLKASAGNLYSVYVTTTATGLLMVFNSATVPGDGAVTPIHCVPVVLNGSIANASLTFSPGPAESYSTGISVAFSTGTNCFAKTASATAFFHASVQ